MCTSDLLDQRAFSDNFDQRLALVSLLVDIADITGSIASFKLDRDGMMDALKPLDDVSSALLGNNHRPHKSSKQYV